MKHAPLLLLELVMKFRWIKGSSSNAQRGFGFGRNMPAFQETITRGFGFAVLALNFRSVTWPEHSGVFKSP